MQIDRPTNWLLVCSRCFPWESCSNKPLRTLLHLRSSKTDFWNRFCIQRSLRPRNVHQQLMMHAFSVFSGCRCLYDLWVTRLGKSLKRAVSTNIVRKSSPAENDRTIPRHSCFVNYSGHLFISSILDRRSNDLCQHDTHLLTNSTSSKLQLDKPWQASLSMPLNHWLINHMLL